MRGTAAGEGVQTQAQTKAWDENADRIGLGKGESAKERGTFVWDEKQKRLVRPWEKEQDETSEARFAPISVDRHYENVPSPIDGTVFRSRRHHQEYMRAHGLTLSSDFDKPGGEWDRAEKQRAAPFSTPEEQRQRREDLGRRLYEVSKMPQAKYDREVREIARRRAERGPGRVTEE